MDNLDPSIAKALLTLEENKKGISSCTDEEYGFLTELLQSKELNSLFHVYNKILRHQKDDNFRPVLSNAMQINVEVLELLANRTHRDDVKELFQLLQKPHVQAALITHDAVAQKDYYPKLPDFPYEVDEEEETVKIVQLVKSDEALKSGSRVEPILGATIKTDERTGKIMIARVMHGGAADRSGLIHVGDEIQEVNGVSVLGKTPNDVLKLLQKSEGTITFRLVPADGRCSLRESKTRVRAHFTYKSTEDTESPCPEAGLDFDKGDVLHIVCQDDNHWWQARKEGDRNMRAGLIPSRALQEHRLIKQRQQREKSDEDAIKNDDFDREEVPTYEEVARLYPRHGLYRPIVLIGPPGVGRNELKRRLMATDPDKFKTPVPYTSRLPRPGELNGKDYHFVSREQMNEDIQAGKFIEYGEYKGNLYGTNAESVTSLVNAGYVCLLSPHYQALKMLRTSQLKPYVIYIKPPRFEILKETRYDSKARSTFDEANSRGFTDDEFNEILHSAARIEFHYGHWFDEVIINADMSIAFEQLLAAIRKLETEPTWVPASWI